MLDESTDSFYIYSFAESGCVLEMLEALHCGFLMQRTFRVNLTSSRQLPAQDQFASACIASYNPIHVPLRSLPTPCQLLHSSSANVSTIQISTSPSGHHSETSVKPTVLNGLLRLLLLLLALDLKWTRAHLPKFSKTPSLVHLQLCQLDRNRLQEILPLSLPERQP